MQGTAGEARTNSSVMYFYGPPHMAEQKQDDQLEHTYSSYVRIRDIALKTWQRRWTIGRSGERWLEISILAAWHDDDDDLCRKIRHPPNMGLQNTLIASLQMDKTPRTDILDMSLNNLIGRATVMLVLWGLWSTTSRSLLTGALWPGVVAPYRVQSISEIEQSMSANKCLMLNCDCYTAILEAI